MDLSILYWGYMAPSLYKAQNKFHLTLEKMVHDIKNSSQQHNSSVITLLIPDNVNFMRHCVTRSFQPDIHMHYVLTDIFSIVDDIECFSVQSLQFYQTEVLRNV